MQGSQVWSKHRLSSKLQLSAISFQTAQCLSTPFQPRFQEHALVVILEKAPCCASRLCPGKGIGNGPKTNIRTNQADTNAYHSKVNMNRNGVPAHLPCVLWFFWCSQQQEGPPNKQDYWISLLMKIGPQHVFEGRFRTATLTGGAQPRLPRNALSFAASCHGILGDVPVLGWLLKSDGQMICT